MVEKTETYLVNVTILEGRHYAWPSMDSFVRIKVGNQKNCTRIRKNTDSPYYNEYFVFEFKTTLQNLVDKHITLTVIRPRNIWRKKKILGYLTLDILTVWNQPDHIFFQKWAIISSRSPDFIGPRGYLKVTLCVVGKGEQAKIPMTNPKANDEIEGHLLLPEGLTLERQRALFIFKIYKGEDFTKTTTNIMANMKKTITPTKEMPSSYIEITFAGVTVKSSIQKKTSKPFWNEMLTIAELFPPLCQRVKIQLRTTNSNIRAVKYLSLHSIANDQEHGFLPTFGPAYVHFYANDDFGDIYVGKVLMSLHTQLQHDYVISQKHMIRKNILPLNEFTLWKYEPVLLFGAILSVNAIDQRFSTKPVKFEISMGNPLARNVFGSGEGTAPNITPGFIPRTNTKLNWYLDFGHLIPCIYFQNIFPDLRKRFYNANMIEKVALSLKASLDEIEPLFEFERRKIPSEMIEQKLVEALDSLADGCRKYIDMVQPNIDTFVTDLDREKYRLCIRELEDIEGLARIIYDTRTKKKAYRKAQKLYKRLELLIDHPQDCWPDILIYMIHGEKKVAAMQIESEFVTFSLVEEEMGKHCGKIQHLYFNTPLKLKSADYATAACKIDFFLWLGLRRHMEFCFHALPDYFTFPKELPADAIPPYLIVEDRYIFQCRAHIYQGRFHSSTDKSGLADLFARVILDRDSGETRTIHGMLNPVWNQTVVFKDVLIYGSKAGIKSNPPVVLIEIIDKDERCQNDYVGRAMVSPTVKLREEPYTPPLFPPKLKWYKITNIHGVCGEVLACVEFLEMTGPGNERSRTSTAENTSIPDDIKPALAGYKIDILFWGLRQLKKVHMAPISRPKITVECFETTLDSDIITKKDMNFDNTKRDLLVSLPTEELYVPPVSFKLFDNRSFGRFTYAGNHLAYVDQFMCYPLTKEERALKLARGQEKSYDSMDSKAESLQELKPTPKKKQWILAKYTVEKETKKKRKCSVCCARCCARCCGRCKRKKKKTPTLSKSSVTELETRSPEEEFTDWWTKYFASLEPASAATADEDILEKQPKNKNFRLKIYISELENQPEFNGFQDLIIPFTLVKGERTGDEDVDEKHITGIFKGNLKIYRWPPPNGVEYVTPSGLPLGNGYFQDIVSNEPKSFIVRIYCVKGLKLRPKDLSGKSDSYVAVTMGTQQMNNRKHYEAKQINPTFGQLFEMSGIFPKDSLVTVSVWEWDRHSRDDLIGETKIDIENRFYTKHRAHCGIPLEYTEIGACPWRGQEKPTAILEGLCSKGNISAPEYSDTYVRVGPQTFSPILEDGCLPPISYNKEELALAALLRWHEVPVVGCHLVPEYVETRSLYHPHEPGLEQGKIQLWIDIFPSTDLPAPKPVDVTPRKPQGYELRITIWNTEDVVLEEDDFFVGEKRSDIYVKGWIGSADNAQSTDVHYRSLSGEGNFNWRFVFPFQYLVAENKLVITKKGAFEIVASEQKVPCRLKLQVWDNDTFSPNDFLGSVTMDLIRMPRGARSAKKCSLKLLEPTAPTINLFKIKRTKGWWPFRGVDPKKNEISLAGKLEAEFHLVTKDEADMDPVGLGRKEPHALPKPNRPDTSFSFFKNPFKLLKYLICRHYKWRLIRCLFLIMLTAFIGLAIYSFPGYSVKKFLGA